MLENGKAVNPIEISKQEQQSFDHILTLEMIWSFLHDDTTWQHYRNALWEQIYVAFQLLLISRI